MIFRSGECNQGFIASVNCTCNVFIQANLPQCVGTSMFLRNNKDKLETDLYSPISLISRGIRTLQRNPPFAYRYSRDFLYAHEQ